MIIVTGGAGFIGSNLVKALNRKGYSDILIVDEVENEDKFTNMNGLKYSGFCEKSEFIKKIEKNDITAKNIDIIFHQGACSNTMEDRYDYIMETNYYYSKKLLEFSSKNGNPFIYASSASVYGKGENGFRELKECENPINLYALSKKKFDDYVRTIINEIDIQVVGLRYFNVFGPNENHKGNMKSVINKFYYQLKESGTIDIFEGFNGISSGEHKRDFVYVEDVIDVNLFFMENKNIRGIFNVGTECPKTFNEVATYLIKNNNGGKINYITPPKRLINQYQNYTCANCTKLRESGYKKKFLDIESSINNYCKQLDTLT